MPKKDEYGNESISMLKGADRVRLRPPLYSVLIIWRMYSFILRDSSNSIDEAVEGYGDRINITRFPDGTIEVEDFGRGIPLDYNVKEQKI